MTAWLNNLVLDLMIGKKKYRYDPLARLFLDAHPADALALITRLKESREFVMRAF